MYRQAAEHGQVLNHVVLAVAMDVFPELGVAETVSGILLAAGCDDPGTPKVQD